MAFPPRVGRAEPHFFSPFFFPPSPTERSETPPLYSIWFIPPTMLFFFSLFHERKHKLPPPGFGNPLARRPPFFFFREKDGWIVFFPPFPGPAPTLRSLKLPFFFSSSPSKPEKSSTVPPLPPLPPTHDWSFIPCSRPPLRSLVRSPYPVHDRIHRHPKFSFFLPNDDRNPESPIISLLLQHSANTAVSFFFFFFFPLLCRVRKKLLVLPLSLPSRRFSFSCSNTSTALPFNFTYSQKPLLYPLPPLPPQETRS